MKKRIISVFLLIAMLTGPILTACSEAPAQDETESTPASVETTAAPDETDAETEEAELVDQIEQKDYNGYEFNYLAYSVPREDGTARTLTEFWVEEDSAEPIAAAVWKRNLFINEKLNVKIAMTPSADVAGDVRRAVSSGDNSYDMAGPYKQPAFSVALEGITRDWNTLDIDYEKPWWSQNAREKLDVKGYQFLMSGAILVTEIDDTLAMMYNKNLGENYGLEDVYDVVLEYKWTNEKFMEMTSAVSDDLNGDGIMRPGQDVYGYIQDPDSMSKNWLFSSNLANSRVTEDGTMDFNVDVDRVQGLLDMMAPYFQTDNVNSDLNLYTGMTYFQEDKIYMYAIIVHNVEELRDMESDFGIIPYPMFDEAQGEYITHVGYGSPILLLPILNTENDERLADILEALAITSKQWLIPAYYETTLKEKIARDPDTAKMLDIIVDSMTYDLSYLLNTGIVPNTYQLISKGSNNFASTWAKGEKRNIAIAQKSVDKLIEAGVTQNGG